MQRARILAWELPKLGWDVEVLAPRASEIRQDVIEEDAETFFAPGIPLHQVGSVARRLLESLGSRTHVWRTLWPMWQLGNKLISSKKYDLVYFTTTTFMYFVLGPIWKKKYRIPYVVDFHDPWVKEKSSGARLRPVQKRLLERASGLAERWVMRDTDGVVSVSPNYIAELQARYVGANPVWLAPDRHAVIPFGVLERDLTETAAAMSPVQQTEDELVISYIGAGGPIMARSFALICRALAALRSRGSADVERVRLQSYGTLYGWNRGDAKPFEVIAKEFGVDDLVAESPERVSYRHSIELLLRSDGAFILGVDDAAYTPSKLFSYGLSGKPLLASLRREGPAFAQFEDTPQLGHALWFDQTSEMPLGEATKIVGDFLNEVAMHRHFDRHQILEAYSASAMARRHVELFEACLRPRHKNSAGFQSN